MKTYVIRVPVTISDYGSDRAVSSHLEFRCYAPDTSSPEEALRAFAAHLGEATQIAIEGGALPRS